MKYSFVVATMNSAKFLERALVSVLSQSYPDYEIVVQDGGSKDGTIDILKKFGLRINWASEPDSGVYDAWNKAVARATGDWVLFLGSDDCLRGKDVLAHCHRHIRQLPEEILFAYGALILGENGKDESIINHSLKAAYLSFFSNMGIPFPATFTRLPLVRDFKFDTEYKIAGDFEFVARFITHDNLARLPLVVSYMERGGISGNTGTRFRLLDERGRVLFGRILPRAQEIALGCMNNILNDSAKLEP